MSWSGTGLYSPGWHLQGVGGGFINKTQNMEICHDNGVQTNFIAYSNFAYVDTHGTSHSFPSNILIGEYITSPSGSVGPCSTFNGVPQAGSAPTNFQATDGSNFALNVSWDSHGPSWYVFDVTTGVINEDVDTYGNQTSFNYSVTPGTVQDSSGNQVLSISTNGSTTTYSYLASDGTTNLNIVATYALQQEQFNTNCPGMGDANAPTFNQSLLTSLLYPDGSSYSFSYDEQGRPTSIILPTGGKITYAYNTTNLGISCEDGGMSGFTKTTPDGEWTYSRSFDTAAKLWTTNVTDPKGNVTTYTFGGTPGSLYDEAPISSEYEINRVYKSGSSTVLKTVTTCYNGNFTNCSTDSTPTGSIPGGDNPPYRKDVYTYVPGIPSPSLSETSYALGLITEDKEYDFGAAMPPTSGSGSFLLSDRIITYGYYSCISNDVTNDGSGHTMSLTTGMCDTNGNQTSVSRWVAGSLYATTTNTFDPTHGLLTQTVDPNGNTTSYTYGSCNGSFPTSVTVGETTAPGGGTSLIGGLTTTMQWNCNGEVPTQSTAPNGGITTYSYLDSSGNPDPFWRLLKTSYPDNGSLVTKYNPYVAANPTNEVPGSPGSIETDQSVDGTQTLSTLVTYDGLGRKIKSAITSDAYGEDYVDTAYDSLGRVATVSNPYQSTSDSSYGTTAYSYDALGRTTKVQVNPGKSNSTTQTWSYSGSSAGNVVIFTNELNNQWQQTLDALGRLKNVLEPSSSGQAANVSTSYSYDALGNLLTVSQVGISGVDTARSTRSFSYDGLSRLTSAVNPESGTTNYVYDGDGNVIQKTSPAPNASSGNQTIGYCYDSLNHLVGKWSAAPPAQCSSTPTTASSSLLAAYTYGTSSNASGNLLGVLLDEQAYLNGTLVADRAFNTYDAMGRPTGDQQTPYSPLGVQIALGYTWNYMGSLTSISNSASNITFSYGMDSVNRLANVTSTLTTNNGTTFPSNLYSVLNYGSAGMTKSTLAGVPNSSGLFNQYRYYDNRGRVLDNEIYATTDTFGSATVTIVGTENTCISGSGNSCMPDTGVVAITAGNASDGVRFGSNDNVQTIATALAGQVNQDSFSPVTATVNSSGPANSSCQNGAITSTPFAPCAVLTLTAREYGQNGNVTFSSVETDANSSSPSFQVSTSGTTLTGGAGVTAQNTNAYTYSLVYDYAGNVHYSTDPYNGAWFYSYDPMNRLIGTQYYNYQGTGITTPAGYAVYQCWSYDSFGNRLVESDQLQANSPTGCPSSLSQSNATHWAQYDANNHVTQTDQLTNGPSYDVAGNVTQDVLNKYVYDAEGRLCAVQNTVSGTSVQYVYDAEGRRVGKGMLNQWPSAGSACAAPTAANGFSLNSMYIRGVNGTEDLEYWPTSGAYRLNVFAAGGLLATYNFSNSGSNPLSLSFAFNDWLGTKRAEINQSGQLVNWWSSDPFGDYLTARNSSADPSEQHFTGQERDNESGNDFFLARYYGSNMGRFMSPDPAGALLATPANPQTFNLYGYVSNNPLVFVDPSGLAECSDVTGYQETNGINTEIFYMPGLCPIPDMPQSLTPLQTRMLQSIPQGQAPAAPSNIPSRARCAAANASSFASLLGISNSNVLGQSLLGNDISTISNIAFGSEADQVNALGQAAISNPTPLNAIYQTASAVGASETGGIRLVQTASQDVWGNSQFYAKAISIGETATAKTISKAFAVFSAAKLAYDVGAYAYAYYNCSAGH